MSCAHDNLDGGKCTNPSCDYCLHEVKFGGLCAVCGQIVEEETSEQIKMTHKDIGITVSLNEAKRLEQQDEKRLLKEKKLSLIVDLDQTILHATWEPSIAEWVKERKETNSESVKDIRQFTLDGSPLIYSIKLRPGLFDFLKDMSKKYEMHIYTMGTRSYAEAVVKEIDPTGELFQDRILSRDENGSMTKKRLERLFPSDISKVVVLDDRGDVWDYSNNLIQIKPYEYFIGIGDINSPFAQPKKDIIPSAETLAKPSNILADNGNDNTLKDIIPSAETLAKPSNILADNENDNTLKQPLTTETIGSKNEDKDMNKEVNTSKDMKNEDNNSKDIINKDNNSSKDNDKNIIEEETSTDKEINNTPVNESNSNNEKDKTDDSKEDTYSDTEDESEVKITKQKDEHVFKVPAPVQKTETHLPNTHDSDDILRVTRRALLDVHNIFFNDLIKRNQKPEVSIILNSLKRKVLKDVNVVFSGIIPLHQTRPEESWIWRMASSFGANCFHELTGKITHLIAANPGTDKAITARKYGHIKIVSPAWITDSVWNWQRQDETKYLLPTIDVSPAESDIEDPESTQLEIDFDWEDDEVDEILDDDETDGDEFDLNSNNESAVNTRENSLSIQNDSDDEYSAFREVEDENHNLTDNSEDDDDMLFDEDELNADLDEIFANDESDSDNDTILKKRNREDYDDDDDGEDKHTSKKRL